MELNPNHPVTREVHDLWHKIAAVLLRKMGKKTLEITLDDLKGLDGTCIVADTRGGAFKLHLVGMEEAEKLARKEGGLPV
jgi:hypothetical protein